MGLRVGLRVGLGGGFNNFFSIRDVLCPVMKDLRHKGQRGSMDVRVRLGAERERECFRRQHSYLNNCHWSD